MAEAFRALRERGVARRREGRLEFDMGDKQQTQLLRTYELAKNKLTDLEEQRDKIEETIIELRQQIQLGKELIGSTSLTKRVQ